MRFSLSIAFIFFALQAHCQWGLSLGSLTRMEGYSVRSEGLFKTYLTVSPEYEFKKWRILGDISFMPKHYTFESTKTHSSSGSTIGGYWETKNIRTYIAEVEYAYGGIQLGASRLKKSSNGKTCFSVGLTAQLEYLLYEREYNHRGTFTLINEFNSQNISQSDYYSEISGPLKVNPDKPFNAIEASEFYTSISFNLGYRFNFNKLFLNLEFSPGVIPRYRTINLFYDPYSNFKPYNNIASLNSGISFLLQGGVKIGYRFDKN